MRARIRVADSVRPLRVDDSGPAVRGLQPATAFLKYGWPCRPQACREIVSLRTVRALAATAQRPRISCRPRLGRANPSANGRLRLDSLMR